MPRKPRIIHSSLVSAIEGKPYLEVFPRPRTIGQANREIAELTRKKRPGINTIMVHADNPNFRVTSRNFRQISESMRSYGKAVKEGKRRLSHKRQPKT